MPEDFATRFCRRNQIPVSSYRSALLARSLYPAARWLRPLLAVLNRDHYSADLELVDNLGHLTRGRDFLNEAHEFNHHPANRSFLRASLRLRVSVRRIQDIFYDTMETGPKP
jgi:hypothetical protein